MNGIVLRPLRSSATTYLLFAAMAFAAAESCLADPFGDVYEVYLDAFVVDPITGGSSSIEAHDALVTFDGAPELAPALLIPGTTPPFDPPNDLIVTEMLTINPDGTETLSFWLEGQDPGGPFPTPGAPLFANPFDPLLPPPNVLLNLFDIDWTGPDAMPAVVVDIVTTVTFEGGAIEVPVEPTLLIVLGEGTTSLDFILEFAAADFELPIPGEPGATPLPATDLHVDITLKKVPEPTTLGLALAFMATGVLQRRR